MKKILFEVSHPKHFHQFKNLIKILKSDFDIKIIARDKDVVINLLQESGIPFDEFGVHKKGMMGKIFAVPRLLYSYAKVVNTYKPDLVVSRSSPYAAIISKFTSMRTLILPDSEVVFFNNNFTVPLSDYIITPDNYTLSHGKSHFKVNGFFESSYLHKDYFKKDLTVFSDLNISEDEKYFIIRLVGWFANHDKGNSGFNDEEKSRLINFLKSKGRIFISGEGDLPDFLKPYRLTIKASQLHTLLSKATLYIGDSQTMATEAALLGTPAIRYNSFVGENDMSNFIKLEKEYELLINVSDFEEVLTAVERMLSNPCLRSTHQIRAKEYFEANGDVNNQTADIIYSLLK